MKYFSFRVLFILILLPPIFYTLTLQGAETYFGNTFSKKLEDTYIGDTKPLLEGTQDIQSVIESNINKFLKSKKLFLWAGGEIHVLVTTKNQIIYPPTYLPDEEHDTSFRDLLKTAQNNFHILSEGLDINLTLKIAHNTKFSNIILTVYILIFSIILYFYSRLISKKIKTEKNASEMELKRLRGQETRYIEELKNIERVRVDLTKRISDIKSDLSDEKKKADMNEEEMINEIIILEEKLEENNNFCKIQEEEIEGLQHQLAQYEKKASDRKKEKGLTIVEKRFKTLYKNIDMDKRATSGFNELTEDMKIKCEEIIHQLNEDSNQVIIKRKVFNKKGHNASLEVKFAHKGRLYFRKEKNGRSHLLVIGTKNTQTKDLEYLDNL